MSASPKSSAVSDDLVDRAVELLDARIGMRPDHGFRDRLRRCLSDQVAQRANGAHGYVDSLRTDDDALQDLLNCVTVQETSFFRHPAQFDALVGRLLPDLHDPVTVWCAACANGQEAYSLAILLEESGRAGTVVASDVSTAALQRANAGCYSGREMGGLSSERRERFFSRTTDGWVVAPALRERVRIMRHNLLDVPPEVVGTAQVIFCRNVLIYFSTERAASFLAGLAERMPARSYLFVGGAETLWHVTDRFESVDLEVSYAYRPVPASRPAPRPASRPATDTSDTVGSGRRRDDLRRASEHRRAAVPRGHDQVRRSRVDGASSPPGPNADQLQQRGHDSMRAGHYAEAAAAFRGWAYLRPDDVMAHVNLAFALERVGEVEAARSAFVTARAALECIDPTTIEAHLGGYHAEELGRLIDQKLEVLVR